MTHAATGPGISGRHSAPRRSTRFVTWAGLFALPAAASGQAPVEPPADPDDIVITGTRIPGSAIGDTAPIAVLGQDAIHALGATTMKELLQRLKPLTAAAGGGDPVMLLNGRRISGYSELGNLPPEAMERVEILPKEEAARFGYPPTATVTNFITKKHFRAVAVQQVASTTTEGGAPVNYAELSSTRIDNARRTSLSVSHLHMRRLLQSQRDIAPDPDFRYATGGNVTAIDGGSIDPALDRLVGRPVTVAALPGTTADRATLAAYAAGANRPAITDIGAFRTLIPRSDTIKVDGTVAMPLSKSLTGSLNLSMEAQRSAGLNGSAPVLLRVPGDSGALPFADDVLVYRYLPDAILRYRNASMTLHAAGTIQGGIGRWTWNVSGNYDRVRATVRAEQGVATGVLQTAVAAGGDPLASVDAAGAPRLTNRSATLTNTVVGKAVANGPLIRLPAGAAQLTISADYARSDSDGRQPGLSDSRLNLTRTTRGASVNADLPIAAADQGVLAFMGRLSANAMLSVSDVSDFGRLFSSNYGLAWAPARPVQLNLSLNDTQVPPAITLLTGPVLTSPNTPFFDFTTGNSVLVTTLTGGNPALDPERRRILTIGAAVTPFKGKDIRLGLDYVDTRIDNQTAYLGSVTPAFQAAFPTVFRRDALGRLTTVDLRPLNLARERDRQLRLVLNGSAQLGPAPPPPAAAPGAAAPDAPPPRPPRPRPMLYGFVTTSLRLEDRLTLRPGIASLDLLDGATLTGTGGRPRWEVDANVGLGLGPININTFSRIQGPTRIRSDLAASDLRFSGLVNIGAYMGLDAERIVRQPWARRVSISLIADNLLNDRIDVRDRSGATPNRFQPAFLDPIGRSLRLGVRKLF